MEWRILVAGIPQVPNSFDWEELGALPRPLDFFRVLFTELAGERLAVWTETAAEIEPRELQIVHGCYGSETCGLRSTEQLSLASSMFPLRVHTEAYGLPGMQIIWAYDWEHVGQGGHCRFKHRELRAQFATPQAHAQFERLWRATFGVAPRFRPPIPNGEEKDDR